MLCKEYDENAVVAFSSKFHIRPNTNHCIIYPFDPEEGTTWRRVSFIEGIALTLLNGKRTLKEVARTLAYLFDMAPEKGEETVKELINHSNLEAGREFLQLLPLGNSGQDFTPYPTAKFVQKLIPDGSEEDLRAGVLEVPLCLLLIPSNRCETNCRYCYAEKKFIPQQDHLSLQRWCELIDEAAELGVDLITFTGGDPLTYPGIEILFERIVLRGMVLLIPTKGFISQERAKKFADIGLRKAAIIQISIDGLSDNADKLVGSPGYAERALASIRNLVEQGLFVRTNTVCTPLNVFEVPQLVRKLHHLGVKRSSVTNYSRSCYRHDDALFLSLDQIYWITETMATLKSELNWPDLLCNAAPRDFSIATAEERAQTWKSRPHCSGGTSSMTICPDGKVTLCEQVPQEPPFVVGSVREHSILEVWNSPRIKAFIHPSQELFRDTVCGDCKEFGECHQIYGRCFRDAYFSFKSFYAPPPGCPRAPSTLRMS